jgi:hypothetical protein
MEFTEVTPAAELRQEPPKFVPSTEGNTPPMDDNAVRAIFAKAASEGIDDLNAVVPLSAPMGEPSPAITSSQPTLDVPAKFKLPDGTVDEEKLKASTTRLNEVVETKAKTVDELAKEYKDLQAKLGLLGREEGKLKQEIVTQSQVQSQPLSPVPAPMIQPNQDMEAIRQQLLQLQQNDPIAFAVEIARHVARKEATDVAGPALQMVQASLEQGRDNQIRGNIAALAESDPRILQHYGEVTKELESDPAYFRLKNPHKAAWNEVKERMRLGEAPQRVPAQPSMAPSPTLGRGSPTPVSGLSQPMSPQSLAQQANTVNPYSDEGRRFEEQMRELSKQLG